MRTSRDEYIYTNHQVPLSRKQHALCDGKNESCEFIQVRINKSKSWQEDVTPGLGDIFFFFNSISSEKSDCLLLE